MTIVLGYRKGKKFITRLRWINLAFAILVKEVTPLFYHPLKYTNISWKSGK